MLIFFFLFFYFLWTQTEIYNIKIQPVPDEVPSSAVTGFNLSEKLQHIYTTNKLFWLHLLQVEKYQKDLLPDPKPLKEKMLTVNKKLSDHFHCINDTLKCKLTPEPALPTVQPAKHTTDYQKKIYGWGVLYRLTEWSNKVLKVLNEQKQTELPKTQMKKKQKNKKLRYLILKIARPKTVFLNVF